MKLLALGLSGVAILMPLSVAHPATEVECHAMFRKADIDGDGAVGGAELVPFIASLAASGFAVERIGQLTIKAPDFKDECMRDRLKEVPPPQKASR